MDKVRRVDATLMGIKYGDKSSLNLKIVQSERSMI